MRKFIFVLYILLFSIPLLAQEPLEIFGYFQAVLNNQDGSFKLSSGPLVLNKDESKFLTSDVQQLNLFMSKDLSENFTAWINTEITSSFSSDKMWGSLSLEEAWLRYEYSKALKIKAGYLIPQFNYFNVIKNRMPLIPYIERPLVYETSASGLLPQEDYLPQSAFAEVYGLQEVKGFTVNYSAFVGRAEDSYVSTAGVGSTPSGTDTTLFLSVGGRLAVEFSNIRVGVSASYDKDNFARTDMTGKRIESTQEDVPRIRFGAEFGLTLGDIFVDGEYIQVTEDPKANVDLDKMTYYGTVGYNFSEEIFVYGTYNYLDDKASPILTKGMQAILLGFGYRPISSVVFKGQYGQYRIDEKNVQSWTVPYVPSYDIDADITSLSVAISVLF